MPVAPCPEKGLLWSVDPMKEKEIIERQLHFADIDVSFFRLFRYATASDYLVIAISSLSAMVAGAIIPLAPVRLYQRSITILIFYVV